MGVAKQSCSGEFMQPFQERQVILRPVTKMDIHSWLSLFITVSLYRFFARERRQKSPWHACSSCVRQCLRSPSQLLERCKTSTRTTWTSPTCGAWSTVRVGGSTGTGWPFSLAWENCSYQVSLLPFSRELLFGNFLLLQKNAPKQLAIKRGPPERQKSLNRQWLFFPSPSPLCCFVCPTSWLIISMSTRWNCGRTSHWSQNFKFTSLTPSRLCCPRWRIPFHSSSSVSPDKRSARSCGAVSAGSAARRTRAPPTLTRTQRVLPSSSTPTREKTANQRLTNQTCNCFARSLIRRTCENNEVPRAGQSQTSSWNRTAWMDRFWWTNIVNIWSLINIWQLEQIQWWHICTEASGKRINMATVHSDMGAYWHPGSRGNIVQDA